MDLLYKKFPGLACWGPKEEEAWGSRIEVGISYMNIKEPYDPKTHVKDYKTNYCPGSWQQEKGEKVAVDSSTKEGVCRKKEVTTPFYFDFERPTTDGSTADEMGDWSRLTEKQTMTGKNF